MRKRILFVLTAACALFSAENAEAIGFTIDAQSIVDRSSYLLDVDFAPFFDPAATVVLDFEGPWSIPLGSPDNFNLGTAGSTYADQGVIFGSGDLFMGGAAGFGPFSGATVIGDSVYPYNGAIEARFLQPGTSTVWSFESVAIHVADGPTNETRAEFYDAGMNLLGTVIAPSGIERGGWNGFLGFSDPRGIHLIRLLNSGGDDYYVDNLTFGPRPDSTAIPEPATLLMTCTGLASLAFRRRRHSRL